MALRKAVHGRRNAGPAHHPKTHYRKATAVSDRALHGAGMSEPPPTCHGLAQWLCRELTEIHQTQLSFILRNFNYAYFLGRSRQNNPCHICIPMIGLVVFW